MQVAEWNHEALNIKKGMIRVDGATVRSRFRQGSQQERGGVDFRRTLCKGRGSKILRSEPEELHCSPQKIEFQVGRSRLKGQRRSPRHASLLDPASATVKAPFKHSKPILMRQSHF